MPVRALKQVILNVGADQIPRGKTKNARKGIETVLALGGGQPSECVDVEKQRMPVRALKH